MAGVEGEILIGQPVDVVFDYVADQSNEPQYNPRMVRAEKITPGPGPVPHPGAGWRRNGLRAPVLGDYGRLVIVQRLAVMRSSSPARRVR
jgi:hypothetical protein